MRDTLGNRLGASETVGRRAPTTLSIVGNDARGDPNRASVHPRPPSENPPSLTPFTRPRRPLDDEFSYQPVLHGEGMACHAQLQY